MAFLRSVLHMVWMMLTVVPYALAIVVGAFWRDRASLYWIAVAWLGTKARIVDTRKTTPGLRTLEKYAVRVGGGHNHRTGLYDMVLVKDNHLGGLGISEAVSRARALWPGRDPLGACLLVGPAPRVPEPAMTTVAAV